MFKATDFKLIRRLCPDELNKLLRLLEIDAPNFDDGDEFEIYKDLDSAIDRKFCDRLNCKSDLDGYAKLLDRGGIEFDSGETRNSMLKKVLANRETILHGQPVTARTRNVKLTCRRAAKSFDLKKFARQIQNSVETLLAVVPASAPPKKFDSPIQNVDEETFALLEQINKIFDKI